MESNRSPQAGAAKLNIAHEYAASQQQITQLQNELQETRQTLNASSLGLHVSKSRSSLGSADNPYVKDDLRRVQTENTQLKTRIEDLNRENIDLQARLQSFAPDDDKGTHTLEDSYAALAGAGSQVDFP